MTGDHDREFSGIIPVEAARLPPASFCLITAYD
jgi:hypothetical protein